MSTTTAVLVAKIRDQGVNRWTKTINISATQAGMAIAGMGVAAFMAMKKISDYGAEIYDLSSATGIAVENVQSLRYAFEQTGGSGNSLSGAIRGINTFMRTAATGSKEYIDLLDQLGIQYSDLRAMSPEQAFMTLTDAVGGLDNAMEKNIAATTIFGGRYAQQVTGALDQAGGSLQGLVDQFEATGNAMSGDQIDKLKQYSDAMTDISFEGKKLAADVLIPLMPLMREFLENFAHLASSIAPEVIVALTGTAETFAFIGRKIFDLSEYLLNLQQNLNFVGDTFNWLINPVGAATGTILTFLAAAADADAALQDWEKAADNAAVTQEAATLITALYTEAMNGNATALATLTEELEKLESQGANTLDILDNLHAEQQRLADIDAALAMETGTLTRSTEGLTREMLDTEKQSVDTAIALLQLEAVIQRGPTVIAAQIAALQTYRETLDSLVPSSDAGATTGDPLGLDKSAEAAADLKVDLKELLLEQQQSETEHEQRVIDRIEAEKAAELARIEEVEAAQADADAAKLAAQERGFAMMERFSGSVASAAIEGKEQWKHFWVSFRNQILVTLAVKGFMALMKFALPGSGSVFGAIGGFLGLSGGGTVPGPIPSASGGIVVGGALGDTTTVNLTPGERVLSRQERIAYEQGDRRGTSKTPININFQSTVGPYSAAVQPEMAEFILDTLRNAGVDV